MEISVELHKNLKIELLYDPAIPLLGIHTKEFKSRYNKDTCTPMFIAALFTIVKLWKQPKYLTMMNRLRKSHLQISGWHISFKSEVDFLKVISSKARLQTIKLDFSGRRY
jgi:hypothetical protein